MHPALLDYLPMDRRHALAEGRSLPEHSEGAALFADISGFTPLTEALAQALGARRGAEALSRHTNQVYEVLTHQVHQYRGSVIGFAGDAITCWFDADPGQRATACALAMQQGMIAFAEIPLTDGSILSLTIKVAVVQGPVHRIVVGDPTLQRLEVLAGQTLARLAEAEHLAEKGEVVLDERTAARLGDWLQVAAWREQGETRIAVVAALRQPVPPTPWPPLAPTRLDETALRSRLLPLVYERLQAGHGEFLTELRPVVALFLRFSGLDYEGDGEAGRKLDQYICTVQHIVTQYGGTLLDITMGDKGSYLYAAFGAPIAHEDDVERAVSAALALRQPPAGGGVVAVQIGLSRGTMRTGAYGGSQSRTYGALGDEVNLAARLMQRAAPGQVLASGRVQAATARRFTWQPLDAVRLKGKADLIPLFALTGERTRSILHLHEPTYALPMVGRAAELTEIEARLGLAQARQGQLVGITAEAGMGKSRLVAEVIQRATARGVVVHSGQCESYGTATPYLVWQPIWRSLFELDPSASLAEQEVTLNRMLSALDPTLLPRLPLLGPVLGLPLADNELTRPFDAPLRKASREALLVDVLRARAEAAAQAGTALLLVLEDVHWLDPLSHDLLEVFGRISATLPLLILLAYRPPTLSRLQVPRITRLPNFSELALGALSTPDMAGLIRGKLQQLIPAETRPLPEELIQAISTRAEGVPFHAEELINYLHEQRLDLWQERVLERLELPASLHRLVLSRIDQLTETQKIILKVASVIGRVFSFRWLLGYYPVLGRPDRVRSELEELRRLDLTPLEQPEPELTYLFKHIITQEVAYESMTHERRALLHEQIALYLEEAEAVSPLDLLAYHYDRSSNLAKRREYLWRAGAAAQAAYANEAATDYYQRLLPLLTEPTQQVESLLSLGEVMGLTGEVDGARRALQQALALAEQAGELASQARCQRAMGRFLTARGEYSAALWWLESARRGFETLGARVEWSLTLSEIGYLLYQQGDYPSAQTMQEQSLALGQGALGTRDLTRVMNRLGLIAHRRGDYPTAAEIFEKCLHLTQADGDKQFSIHFSSNLAMVVGAQGDLARGRALYEDVLGLHREIGDKDDLANSLNNLGYTLLQMDDVAGAAAYLEESLMLRRELGDKWAVNSSLGNLGLLAIWQGNCALAATYYEESLRLALELDDRRQGAYNLIGMAGVLALSNVAPANQREWARRALHLLSAADSFMRSQGDKIESLEALLYERVLEVARSRLDEESFAAAWDEGQAMSLEEAVAEALAPDDTSPGSG